MNKIRQPDSNQVRDRLIPAPIFLPDVNELAKQSFYRGECRDAFFRYYSDALNGSVAAQSIVSYMYLVGYVDTEERIETAIIWAKRAAEHCYPYGHWVYGWSLLEAGETTAGVSHLIESAERGFAPAIYHLASFSINGVILKRDELLAQSLLELGSDLGHIGSMEALSGLYRAGRFGRGKQIKALLAFPLVVARRLARSLAIEKTSERTLIYARFIAFEAEYRQRADESVDFKLVERVNRFLAKLT